MNEPSEWVSLGEAAQIIGVHPATIRNWAEQGELPFRRTPGGHRRFRRADLQQSLNRPRAAIFQGNFLYPDRKILILLVDIGGLDDQPAQYDIFLAVEKGDVILVNDGVAQVVARRAQGGG